MNTRKGVLPKGLLHVFNYFRFYVVPSYECVWYTHAYKVYVYLPPSVCTDPQWVIFKTNCSAYSYSYTQHVTAFSTGTYKGSNKQPFCVCVQCLCAKYMWTTIICILANYLIEITTVSCFVRESYKKIYNEIKKANFKGVH